MPLVRNQFPTASAEEIQRLKSLVKKVDNLERVEESKAKTTSVPAPQRSRQSSKKSTDVFENIANVEITREAIQIDNPIKLGLILTPEITPYRWQFEELMRLAGYLTTGDYTTKTTPTVEDPYRLVIAAANGSGKDMMIIALFSVWFALTGVRNRVIITSSSFEQTKFQTEPHIRNLADRANAKFGTLFRYTQFHYVCPELGSEIKLFATDEAKRAEGYHPFPGGRMALIINEAKSVTPEIFDAVSRCTGYSYRIEISSPGRRSGDMFNHVTTPDTIAYPAPAVLGKWYYRKVTAYECPCIPESHIRAMIYEKGETDPWVRSSIYAEFSDYNEPVVIPERIFDRCLKTNVPEAGDDIGIGVDFAGGGDEDAGWVRKGNKIIHKFFFRLADTVAAVRLIDKELSPWKDVKYTFNADNGGIGQAFIDQLKDLGWTVLRRNNQSPAYKPREYLNLGAEMWFHTKRLIERCDIILPDGIDKFRLQMTTRYYKGFDTTQGKLALESKAEARANGHNSPDRADGFVLCFFSYRPSKAKDPPKDPRFEGQRPVTPQELVELYAKGQIRRYVPPRVGGRYTLLNGKI